MRAEIAHLWSKIDSYPDKELDILNIFNDSELAFLIAIDHESNPEKKKDYAIKLAQIQSLMKKTPLGYDIYELHSWIQEFQNNTFWRDNIKINDKKISRKKIKKWCNDAYNTLRYYLLSAGVVDLNIGESGTQPKDEEKQKEANQYE